MCNGIIGKLVEKSLGCSEDTQAPPYKETRKNRNAMIEKNKNIGDHG